MAAHNTIIPVESMDKLGSPTGVGSQAEVFRAIRIDTQEIIALRIPFLERDADTRQRQIQELAQRLEPFLHLSHPNLVRHLHYQTVIPDEAAQRMRGGLPDLPEYQMLMEFCTGGTLRKYIETNCLTIALLQNLVQQLVSGLSYLCQQGFAHRDIKTENIFMSQPNAENCLLKIGDIGDVKRIVGEFTHRDELSSGKGTYEFMSPEMIIGDASPLHVAANDAREDSGLIVGRRSDVWSLGCVVIHMITGRLPRFYKILPNGDRMRLKIPMAIMYFVGSSEGSPTIPRELPKELHNFIEKCLTRQVKNRPYATALQGHPFLTTVNVSEWRLPARETDP
ncbi:uncharacterized protein LOC129585358 [Paramacrobiotus metropolitanus]|uniref:uncharacterized protein LOC129585358 n=1 Tax=Paramacrobiotus metropolitanus TaxID=2943436 RepID=UPI0024456A1C|nr:uncharacterized protein LOC129585358 [Paramacrobiotus metropolitanus]